MLPFVMGMILLVTACETVSINSTCPPLVEYSQDFQKRAAKRYEELEKDNELRVVITDGKVLRDKCRAIK